jgi:hypothetical protein
MSFSPIKTNRQSIFSIVVFAAYLLLLAFSICHHEPWGDELHSWNIAKGSESLGQLFANSRYEGHPPVWYVLMWCLSRLTHNLVYLQCLQYLLITSAVYLAVFKSRLPDLAKWLLPFGYFFLYEYGTLSRNYAVGILLAFAICVWLGQKRQGSLGYYLLLFGLSNTHLLGLLLAASLHLYFLLGCDKKLRLTHLFGALVLLPAAWFIFPPGDSQMNTSFWLRIWSDRMFDNILAAPLKAFVPVPAWWEPHFWNTHFMQDQSMWLIGTCSLLLTALAGWILRKDKRSLTVFLVNVVLTCLVALVFPITSVRYTGFLFIGFLVASWLHSSSKPLTGSSKALLCGLLLLQLGGSIIALPRDYREPFSNAYRVNELLRQVPATDSVACDYWCLNNVAAYSDQAVYCIELQKNVSFLLWDKALAAVTGQAHGYVAGLNHLVQTAHLSRVWMVSCHGPDVLARKDPPLTTHFAVQLKSHAEGAIEPGSNIYLYLLTPVAP